jgi:heme-degrading monooxygenase HmoA
VPLAGERNGSLAMAAIWTPALAAHDGFLLEEVWPSIDHPDEVVILVRWSRWQQWKSFPSNT